MTYRGPCHTCVYLAACLDAYANGEPPWRPECEHRVPHRRITDADWQRVAGLSHHDAARVLGCTYQAVQWRRKRESDAAPECDTCRARPMCRLIERSGALLPCMRDVAVDADDARLMRAERMTG